MNRISREHKLKDQKDIKTTEAAEEDLNNLSDEIRDRVVDKIYDAAKIPDHYVKSLTGTILQKIEVGKKYRVILYEMEEKLIILSVGHHDDIYNKEKIETFEEVVESEYK